MIATYSACQGCGESFLGFGYAGEPCSAECAEIIDKTGPEPMDSETK